ncbi:MAG: hypothetical protein P8Y53_01910 [Pseudolabrys sp.]
MREVDELSLRLQSERLLPAWPMNADRADDALADIERGREEVKDFDVHAPIRAKFGAQECVVFYEFLAERDQRGCPMDTAAKPLVAFMVIGPIGRVSLGVEVRRCRDQLDQPPGAFAR